MRSVVVLYLLASVPSCDRAFRLDRPPDAAIDAPDAPLFQDASLLEIGCADGTREALVALEDYPRIAGCAGAWSVGGVIPAMTPTCARGAGNGSLNALGTGCNASDLCAEGWDVCETSLEVRGAISPLTSCAELPFPVDTLFITRQSGPGAGKCDQSGTNDVFGCGTIGFTAESSSCGALTQQTPNDCFDIRPLGWQCTEPGEAGNITKIDPDHGGGVLCCRRVQRATF